MLTKRAQGRPAKLPDEEKDRAICQDYVGGLRVEEVAEKHGLANPSSIYPILARNGVPLRSQPITGPDTGDEDKEGAT